MKILIISFLLCFFPISVISVWAQKTVKGYVFDDLNGNGKKDRNEKGIAGVAVSNGEDVVVTDANGRYELPIDDDNIIFVIKPAGYNTPVDRKNLPFFYYNHKPAGSPQQRFEGVSPTGRLPQSVDFALVRNDAESDNFRFFAFGDPQTRNEQDVDWFKQAIVNDAKIIEGISFGISLGDIVNDDLNIFPLYIDAVAEIGVRWHNVIGNHDRNTDATENKYLDETFERYFGPATYAFQHGRTHFLILNNIMISTPGRYRDGLTDIQFTFIENYLKLVDKNDLVIFCMHALWPFSRNVNDEALKFFALLKDHENVLMLAGHSHIQQQIFMNKTHGWEGEKPLHMFNVGTANGSWYSAEFDENGIPVSPMTDGTPKGYAIVNIEGVKYTFDYKVAGKPSDYVMNIYYPKVVPQLPNAANFYSLVVNFFLGKSDDKIEYRINDGRWQEMRRVDEPDPYFVYLSQRWDFTETLLSGTRRPHPPAICTHLWKGRIDTTLDIGEHKIEVRVTDMFGRLHQREVIYRIEEHPLGPTYYQ